MDKKAMAISVGLMAMGWLALPLVYILIKRKPDNEDKIMREKMAKYALGPVYKAKEYKRSLETKEEK